MARSYRISSAWQRREAVSLSRGLRSHTVGEPFGAQDGDGRLRRRPRAYPRDYAQLRPIEEEGIRAGSQKDPCCHTERGAHPAYEPGDSAGCPCVPACVAGFIRGSFTFTGTSAIRGSPDDLCSKKQVARKRSVRSSVLANQEPPGTISRCRADQQPEPGIEWKH